MTGDHSTSRFERHARLGLAAGAAVGILLAAAGALAPSLPGEGRLRRDAIAWVNDKAISAEDLARALQQVAGHNRDKISDEDRARVLNRLIDEELLIQRGVEMGLIDSDSTVREAIANAVINASVANVISKEPTEEELRTFYASHKGVFEPEEVQPYHMIREGVKAEYIRRARDEAVQELLDSLRKEVTIVLSPQAPH